MSYCSNTFNEFKKKYSNPDRPMVIIFNRPGNDPIIAELTSLDFHCSFPGQRVNVEGIVINQSIPCPKSELNMVHKRIIFNHRATTVLWEDGTVTVVKKAEEDAYDPEKAVAIAFMKKALGNTNAHNKILRKDVPSALQEAQEREEKKREKVKKKEYVKSVMNHPFKSIVDAFTNTLERLENTMEERKDAPESDS